VIVWRATYWTTVPHEDQSYKPLRAIQLPINFDFVERVVKEKGKPRMIRVDNGPEFIGSIFSEWCYDNKIELHYIQPGKPNQNGYIERFNRSYRQDVLDIHLFESIDQVRYYTEEFINDYNLYRPHESLNEMSPINYKLQKIKV
jgi:putative transposase